MSRKKERQIKPVRVLNGQYTLNEIEEVVDQIEYSDNVIVWVRPENIIGISIDEEKTKRLYESENHLSTGFMLSNLLVGEYCRSHTYQGTINHLKDNLDLILDNAIYVAKNFYSTTPSYDIFNCQQLVTKENVSSLFKKAKNAYQNADECEKIFLSILFLDFFDVIYCIDYITEENKACIGIDFFNKEEQILLKEIKRMGLLVHSGKANIMLKDCQK